MSISYVNSIRRTKSSRILTMTLHQSPPAKPDPLHPLPLQFRLQRNRSNPKQQNRMRKRVRRRPPSFFKVDHSPLCDCRCLCESAMELDEEEFEVEEKSKDTRPQIVEGMHQYLAFPHFFFFFSFFLMALQYRRTCLRPYLRSRRSGIWRLASPWFW